MLIATVNDEKRALGDRRKALEELRKIVPGYHAELTAEGQLIKNNKEAIDDYLVALNKQIALKAYQEKLEEAYRKRAELEMKLMEMSKLSTGVAKKASEENVLKALRTYVNRSKRKTADKRAFAKSATLEIANANGLELPEDLKAAIESLDDEQTEAKVVNVAGNYNDVHDNKEVKGLGIKN